MEETQFFDLPQELIWKMLYYLPPKDTVHFCETYSGAAIICRDNYFWLKKIRKDFGVVFERELAEKGIPAENRVETYQQYWKEAPSQLLFCAKEGRVDCVFDLLQLGIDPDHQDIDPDYRGTRKWTALMLASMHGHIRTVELLLEHGAKPNIQNKSGYTALMRASNTRIVALLLGYGALPNIQTQFGMTALMGASTFGEVDIGALLLGYGAELDLQNVDGQTALEQAASGGHIHMVRMLLEHGAKTNIQNKSGYTALEMARAFGYAGVVALLESVSQT